MNTFCTIITEDYLHQALTLYDSIKRYDPAAKFSILISNFLENVPSVELVEKAQGIDVFFLNDIEEQGNAKEIIKKYYSTYKDGMRWSLKPVLLQYLLFRKEFEKVIFLDSDLYFFREFAFLFMALDENNILLSPHWRSLDPKVDEDNFYLNLSEGMFNGGFVGVNKESTKFLQWWSGVCEFKCINNKEKGLYVDQKYLDLVPVYFDKVGIIKHRGCNIANWNQVHCKRMVSPQGQVFIGGNDPVIFIHFTNSTIKGILNGSDSLLMDYLEEYLKIMKTYKAGSIESLMNNRTNYKKKDVKVGRKKGNFLYERIKNFLKVRKD